MIASIILRVTAGIAVFATFAAMDAGDLVRIGGCAWGWLLFVSGLVRLDGLRGGNDARTGTNRGV